MTLVCNGWNPLLLHARKECCNLTILKQLKMWDYRRNSFPFTGSNWVWSSVHMIKIPPNEILFTLNLHKICFVEEIISAKICPASYINRTSSDCNTLNLTIILFQLDNNSVSPWKLNIVLCNTDLKMK